MPPFGRIGTGGNDMQPLTDYIHRSAVITCCPSGRLHTRFARLHAALRADWERENEGNGGDEGRTGNVKVFRTQSPRSGVCNPPAGRHVIAASAAYVIRRSRYVITRSVYVIIPKGCVYGQRQSKIGESSSKGVFMNFSDCRGVPRRSRSMTSISMSKSSGRWA